MKTLTKKFLHMAAVLATVLNLAACGTLAPRDNSGYNTMNRGVIVSVPYTESVPCPYQVLFIAPDNSLWELDEAPESDPGYYMDKNRAQFETQPLIKLLDDVVYADWAAAGRIAITSDNSLWLLDNGVVNPNSYWAQEMADSVQSAAMGGDCVLAVKTDGSLWRWRNIINLQESFAAVSTGKVPLHPQLFMEDVKQVSAGAGHFLALKNDGSVWEWGSFYYSDDVAREPVTKIEPEMIMSDVEQIYAGSSFSLAVDNSGVLWAWGSNYLGQLGDGTSVNRFSPVKVTENVAWAEITGQAVFAVKTDGSLWAWGESVESASPILMMEGEEDNEIVSIRESKTISDSRLGILKSDGSLWVAYNYNLPPAKKIDGVLYADGGHAVKTDGSIWDIHREIMVLPPGTALTEGQE